MTQADVDRRNSKVRASRVHRLDSDGRQQQENAPEAPGPRQPSIPATEQQPTQPTLLESTNRGIPGVNLTLPWPPTVNHYWKITRTGKVYIWEPGRSFRARVKLLAHGLPMTSGSLTVTVLAYPPDKRRRDIDNLAKAALDALQHAGLIEDDSLIDRLIIERCGRHPFGKLEVTIKGK